jgi:hypothetical protein
MFPPFPILCPHKLSADAADLDNHERKFAATNFVTASNFKIAGVAQSTK